MVTLQKKLNVSPPRWCWRAWFLPQIDCCLVEMMVSETLAAGLGASQKPGLEMWGGVRGGDYPCNQPDVKDRFFRLPENHIYEILVS